MNCRFRKKHKPRPCTIPEECLAELAEELKKKYMSHGEIIEFIGKTCNKRHDLEPILGIMEARGFLIAQEKRKVTHGYKFYYTIMTKEKYEKIEEEHRENAKRRLLAAVSY